MKHSAVALVTAALLAPLAIAAMRWTQANDAGPPPDAPVTVRAAAMVPVVQPLVHPVASTVATAWTDDPTTRYLAMRDDIDPRPRLQLIDAWARGASGAPSDLLSYALVDPDAAVRERAQSLFERSLASQR